MQVERIKRQERWPIKPTRFAKHWGWFRRICNEPRERTFHQSNTSWWAATRGDAAENPIGNELSCGKWFELQTLKNGKAEKNEFHNFPDFPRHLINFFWTYWWNFGLIILHFSFSFVKTNWSWRKTKPRRQNAQNLLLFQMAFMELWSVKEERV